MLTMNTNTKKYIQFPSSVSEQLKETRRKEGLTIDNISKRIRVPNKYLEALENGEYDKLPANVYACGFLRKYAKFLNLPMNELADFYTKERRIFYNISNKNKGDAGIVAKKFSSRRFYITPKIIAFFSLIALIAIITGYFLYQVNFLISPPRLNIEIPAQDIEVFESRIRVSGRTDYGASVKINNQSIAIDNDGYFVQEINLTSGLNVLEIQAANRLGKESRVVRKIMYQELIDQ